jgi:GINS complex subunit 4
MDAQDESALLEEIMGAEDESPDVSQGDEQLNERVVALIQHVRNEKAAPEILPFAHASFNAVSMALEQQKEAISVTPESANERFHLSLYEMEVERIEYLLASYIRVRLAKIQAYASWILHQVELRERLSDEERSFASRYVMLKHRHFAESGGRRIPEGIISLKDPSTFRQPDLTKRVFVRVVTGLGEVALESEATRRLGGTAEAEELTKGKSGIARYDTVQKHVLDGHIVLS